MMTSHQFNAALARLGITTEGKVDAGQKAFARTIGVNDRTVRRWASGESEVPPAIAMLLNLMIRTRKTGKDLKP